MPRFKPPPLRLPGPLSALPRPALLLIALLVAINAVFWAGAAVVLHFYPKLISAAVPLPGGPWRRNTRPRPLPETNIRLPLLTDDPHIEELLPSRHTRLAGLWLNRRGDDSEPGPFAGRTAVFVDAENFQMLAYERRPLGLDVSIVPWAKASDAALGAAYLVVSCPGPGDPHDHSHACSMRDIVADRLRLGRPLLAVCLSHQIVADAIGIPPSSDPSLLLLFRPAPSAAMTGRVVPRIRPLLDKELGKDVIVHADHVEEGKPLSIYLVPLDAPHQGMQKILDVFAEPASAGFYNIFFTFRVVPGTLSALLSLYLKVPSKVPREHHLVAYLLDRLDRPHDVLHARNNRYDSGLADTGATDCFGDGTTKTVFLSKLMMVERGSALGCGVSVAGESAGKRLYPLVSELAADGILVAVAFRVLKTARQPYYRWLAQPVTTAEVVQAYRANALFDAHRDDPEFGYRFLADEACGAWQPMSDRTAWRICSGNGWWSAFGKRKRRSKGGKVGPRVHDDLLADITEHHTAEGKLYLYAIKDVWSRRIVGYSIDSRMKSRLAVNALHNAVARRESFFGLLQNNVLDRRTWTTRQQLSTAIVTWIERTYHRRRRQRSLARLTPIESETIITPPASQAAILKLSPIGAADPNWTDYPWPVTGEGLDPDLIEDVRRFPPIMLWFLHDRYDLGLMLLAGDDAPTSLMRVRDGVEAMRWSGGAAGLVQAMILARSAPDPKLEIRVPFVVVGIIYEARPNVTVDAAAIYLKSSNAALLRGSSSTIHSNTALVAVLRDALTGARLPADAVQLLDATSRESAKELMRARGLVDVLIPRGGASLIRTVVEESTVPVIETGTGNCHVYIDVVADVEKALAVTLNSKTQRLNEVEG
ncbi:hypothetical protein QBC39DRAFT_436336 [Podospora conica]|nr:hypothetical protein QBC39DRAFT_436336 [Schizothecium conicum]